MRQAHECTKSIDPPRLPVASGQYDPGPGEVRAVLAPVKTKPPAAVAFGQS
jgi:hypothetical protein